MKAGKIVSEVFQGWSFVSNYEFNRLGRLWVVWSAAVRMTPVFKSGQMITCSVLLQGETEEFLLLCLCFEYCRREEGVVGRYAQSP